MCFSATASFGAGLVLSAVGVASIRKARSRSQLMFAIIPFLFCVQQCCEGFLWLALTHPSYAWMQGTCTVLFLIFAHVVWPVFVPIAVMRLEQNAARKRMQKIFVGIGAMVSLFFIYCMMNFHFDSRAEANHIVYITDYPPALDYIAGMFYAIASITPQFLSTVRRMWIFGTTIFISYVLSHIFYHQYVISVWCFFASLISLIVYLILYPAPESESTTEYVAQN